MRVALIALAVLAFLAASAVLARWLTTENAERDKLTALLQAQARGDAAGMLRELDGCANDPACRARVRANAARLRRAGRVEIVRLDSDTAHVVRSRTGPTRVVWRTSATLTVVQCVEVRRAGNALSGLDVELRRISAPIGREASC